MTFGNKMSYMPKLNFANKSVEDYFLKLTEFWMTETGIDGWRLDVCDEVSHVFWKKFRSLVKKINPEALIVGESMHEASSFLSGDEFDSTMNYPFREIALDFFAERKISTVKFEDLMTKNRMLYMDSVSLNMFNILDSHDTERFLTMCSGKKERLKCAVVFQFTYIGIPYIFYGDEVGLDGGYDPLCRKCMIWDKDKQDTDLLRLFSRLCHIRSENKCLVYGDYISYSSSDVLAYRRSIKNSRILVVINNSDQKKNIRCNEISGSYTELLSREKIEIQSEINLDPNEYLVLKQNA